MFSQLDGARDRSEGGLGIGLALARTIIELHGGTIEARSAGPRAGSEFHIRLPLLESDRTVPAEGFPSGPARL
jgi:signal transduction histidine kinase